LKGGREDVQGDEKSGQKRKKQRADANLKRGLGLKLIAEEGYGNQSGGKGPSSGLTSRFSTMKMLLLMMYKGLWSSWTRNPLQKSTIHLSHLN
jgi:hypothetical protein